MKRLLPAILLCLLCAAATGAANASAARQSDDDGAPAAVLPVPSPRQLEWQKMEFYAFFHYGMNTFKDREWGLGNERPADYAPGSVPDCGQWVRAIKSAGMRGAVFVAKHHDGFCMWPTKTTPHGVVNSSAAGPRVDIMRLGADACRKHGIKMGVYLSPWDRNNRTYGTREYADRLYFDQLHEVCANYGQLFEVWFDGANGGTGFYGGDVEISKTIDNLTYYNWPLMLDTVHAMQPSAVAGRMDFRWVGNEAGFASVTNWSPITYDEAMSERNLTEGNEHGTSWIPAESDARATDGGWFWHANETPLPAERLYRMYLETVGRNATLILNVPPSTAGTIPQKSVVELEKLGTLLRTRLGNDLACKARITASVTRADTGGTASAETAPTAVEKSMTSAETGMTHSVKVKKSATRGKRFAARNMLSRRYDTYWAAPDGVCTASITLEWKTPQPLHYIVLQEYIPLGQRIKSFRVMTSTDGRTWTSRADGLTTTVGYKRIVPLNGTTEQYGAPTPARFVRIDILDAKACPVITRLQAF